MPDKLYGAILCVFVYLHFKTSPHVLFRRMLQHRNILWTSPDFTSAWGRVGNDLILIFRVGYSFNAQFTSSVCNKGE